MTQFLRVSFVAIPHAHVDTIELIPVGPVNNKLLDYLSQWQAIFYGCKCQIGRPIRIRDVSENMRAGAMGQLQLKCSDIYENLRTRKAARNVLVRVAVTMADLYPDEEWNFVYVGLTMAYRCLALCNIMVPSPPLNNINLPSCIVVIAGMGKRYLCKVMAFSVLRVILATTRQTSQ